MWHAQCEMEYCGVSASMYLQRECWGKSCKRNDLSNPEATIVGFEDKNEGIPRI
jgi:hypothetical protein